MLFRRVYLSALGDPSRFGDAALPLPTTSPDRVIQLVQLSVLADWLLIDGVQDELRGLLEAAVLSCDDVAEVLSVPGLPNYLTKLVEGLRSGGVELDPERAAAMLVSCGSDEEAGDSALQILRQHPRRGLCALAALQQCAPASAWVGMAEELLDRAPLPHGNVVSALEAAAKPGRANHLQLGVLLRAAHSRRTPLRGFWHGVARGQEKHSVSEADPGATGLFTDSCAQALRAGFFAYLTRCGHETEDAEELIEAVTLFSRQSFAPMRTAQFYGSQVGWAVMRDHVTYPNVLCVAAVKAALGTPPTQPQPYPNAPAPTPAGEALETVHRLLPVILSAARRLGVTERVCQCLMEPGSRVLGRLLTADAIRAVGVDGADSLAAEIVRAEQHVVADWATPAVLHSLSTQSRRSVCQVIAPLLPKLSQPQRDVVSQVLLIGV
eukprot:TRINITY_DN16518_c0_g1_i2.p1 TRINITY_DN16518_c0_g1~~TRINITY_DN16518_c0_g1_i2.p1  ORF type:complete len:437 (+),score=146.41 TRINITY_DN16518_c0_g1_i2:477-1787(+)